MGTIPHLGLLSIGGVLQKDGHMCEYLDAFNYRFSIQETIQKILKATPDLVAITSNSPNYPSAVAIAKRIRKRKFLLS